MPRRPRRPPSLQPRPRSIKGSHALKPVAGMVKTTIMTSVRATGPGAGPSMLNIGAADIVRGHMVVHDLGAGSECVRGPLAAALSRFQFYAHLDDRLASSRLRARRERPCCCRAAEKRDESASFHSISSSASPVNGSGTVRPRALATLRLMTRVYLSARWIGKSPGFAPLRMRST
jgi:hypothetical protein